MDNQPLVNFLGILRLINSASPNPGKTAYQIIQQWVGADSDIRTLKVAQYVIEQTNLATTVIANSQLSDEAKVGVLSTMDGVATGFSLDKGHTQFSHHVPDLRAAISNMVILLSALGLDSNPTNPPEIKDLQKQIDEVLSAFDDAEIDPVLKDVAKRHLGILSVMLSHVHVFGTESALTAYFELMLKIRRSDIGSSEKSHKKVRPIFQKIKDWGDILTAIDKAWNSGAKLLTKADKAKDLLNHLPDL